MEPMIRLLYISTARTPLSQGDLETLLRVSRYNNTKVDVTGLLVTGGRRFLQMLEGPEQAVEALFARINADPRHFAVVVLSRKSIEQRQSAAWAMAFSGAGGIGPDAPGLPEIVAGLVSEIEDPALRAEFSHFAARNAA